MALLRHFLLIGFIFSLFSCVPVEEDGHPNRCDGKKKCRSKTRSPIGANQPARVPPQQKGDFLTPLNKGEIQQLITQTESARTQEVGNQEAERVFVFPIFIGPGLNSLALNYVRPKISFSSNESALNVIAPYSGSVSLTEDRRKYYLNLSKEGLPDLKFEIQKETALLRVSDQQQVSQSQVLVISPTPVILNDDSDAFYCYIHSAIPGLQQSNLNFTSTRMLPRESCQNVAVEMKTN